MSRIRLSLAAAITASLVLAGCSGGDGDEPAAEEPPAEQQIAEGSSLAQTWPLTGLDVPEGKSSELDRPVLVTKIDNTSSSAPQAGLDKADLVVEEMVEGGMTRLAAFFYSELPAQAGPVRSMRASDVGIVSPADATVITSGAAPITQNVIRKAGIPFFGEGSPGMYRAGDRSAPYNLMVDLTEAAAAREGDSARPDDYLPWGEAADLPKGPRATRLSASFGGSHTTSWQLKGGTYQRTNGYAAGNDFAADSVLVLRVQVGDAGYTDPAGNFVPETKFLGKGAAMLFHGGRMIKGTWSKNGHDGALELSTRKGDLVVPAGHTWIELVPAANGNVSFSK